MYSNSRRSTKPGRTGKVGAARSSACTPVISSILRVSMPAAARSGASRYVSHTSRHFSSNWSSRGVLIQPRVRCGLRSASRRKRPMEPAEMSSTMPRATASAARSAWVQWVSSRPSRDGGSHASAMIEQITSGVKVAGVPGRGASIRRWRTDAVPALADQRGASAAPWRVRARVRLAGWANADTVGGQQDNLCAGDQRLGRRVLAHQRLQLATLTI
jgi:hypothetical protein